MVSSKFLAITSAVVAGVKATCSEACGAAFLDKKNDAAVAAFCGFYTEGAYTATVGLPGFAAPCSAAPSAISSACSAAASAAVPTVTLIATLTTTELTTTTTTVSSKYPFATDTEFPGFSELPDDVDPYLAYQKIVASQENTTVAWWYEGLASFIPEGLPEIPGTKSQTLMAYQVRHLNDSMMRIDWSEPIVIGDFSSGDDATVFHNFQSGMNATVPNYYLDGPVTYYISRDETDSRTINLLLVQPGANVTKSTIRGYVYNGQVQFIQYEEKIKSTPLVSTLRFIGSLADVRDPSIKTAKANGYYHAAFTGTLASLFANPNGTTGETHILGNTHKESDVPVLFPRQLNTIKEKFPDFFTGDRITPNWTQILSAKGLPL